MMPLSQRVGYVSRAAAALDPWTRVAIRDRLAAMSKDQADPQLRQLLTAAAAWLAAVSDTGEQAQVDGVLLYMMPAEPAAFTALLADVDDLDGLRLLIGMALRQQEAAAGMARAWWMAFGHALAAAAAAIQDAAELGTMIDSWEL